MQYTDLTAALGVYLQEDLPSAQYLAALPTIVSSAELRIYRDLNLQSTTGLNASLTFTPGLRRLLLVNMTGQTLNALPVQFPWPVVVEGIAAIVPSWLSPSRGRRVRFQPVSLSYIDLVWPEESIVAQPGTPFAYFSMLDDVSVVVAPTPDQQYTVEVMGTWRPAPLSPTNPTSWVSLHMPDLLFDACMVEATGYQRDYGAQSDDPRMAISWEGRYQATLAKCREEELRRSIGRPPPVTFPMNPSIGGPPPPGRGAAA